MLIYLDSKINKKFFICICFLIISLIYTYIPLYTYIKETFFYFVLVCFPYRGHFFFFFFACDWLVFCRSERNLFGLRCAFCSRFAKKRSCLLLSSLRLSCSLGELFSNAANVREILEMLLWNGFLNANFSPCSYSSSKEKQNEQIIFFLFLYSIFLSVVVVCFSWLVLYWISGGMYNSKLSHFIVALYIVLKLF